MKQQGKFTPIIISNLKPVAEESKLLPSSPGCRMNYFTRPEISNIAVGTLAEKLQRLEPKEIPSIYENYCKSPNA
jgi:hypothetical protein